VGRRSVTMRDRGGLAMREVKEISVRKNFGKKKFVALFACARRNFGPKNLDNCNKKFKMESGRG